MNQEIAIDIECLRHEAAKLTKPLSDRLGFETGVFASAIPSDWVSRVTKLAFGSAVSSLERKRLLEFANNARKQWLLPPLNTDDSGDWAKDVRCAIDAGAVAGAISDQNLAGFVSLEDAIFGAGSDLLMPRSSMKIQTTVSSYLAALRPLILKSSELHIVDSYAFRLFGDRSEALWLELLKGIQRLTARSSTPMVRLYVHLWEQHQQIPSRKSLEDSVAKVNEELRSAGASPLRISIAMRDGEIEHDRFVLSVKGGLSLGRGIMLVDERRLVAGKHHTLVSYLSRAALECYHRQFVGSLESCDLIS